MSADPQLTQSRRQFLGTALTASAACLSGYFTPQSATAADSPEAVTYLTPDDSGYKAARQIYNSAVRIQPQLIALCENDSGVQAAVRRANKENLPVAIKAGGHSFEGYCLNEDGLVVNVSSMRDMELDEKTGLFTAGAGCRIVDINNYLLPRGRFLPSGSCQTVGLAGLTLGGGYGIFSRKYGLTCDHLRGVRMVDGHGKLRDSNDEPELLWACKGGGNGHFGVITQLRFQTRVLPREFRSWKFRIYKLDVKGATNLLEQWFRATADLPNDAFSAWVMNGSQVTILLTSTGGPDAIAGVRKILEPLSGKTTKAGPVSLATALPWYYGRSEPENFRNASAGYYRSFDNVRDALPGVFQEVLQTPGLIFQVNTLGGAIASGDGAYPHRSYGYLGEQQCYWDTPAQAEKRLPAIARVGEHIQKAGLTRHYANYPDPNFKNWPTAYYGAENYSRLQKLKREFDPENRIRHPQSVRLAT